MNILCYWARGLASPGLAGTPGLVSLQSTGVYHLNSLNRDNEQFLASLPCNILRNVLRNKKVVITTGPRYNIYAI